jgi:hypothetical protein
MYIESIKRYKKTFFKSLLYDLFSLVSLILIFTGFYTIMGQLVEYLSLILPPLLYASMFYAALASSIVVLLVVLTYFKYKSYSLITKLEFVPLLKNNLWWFPFWGLLYLILNQIVEPLSQGYFLIVGFIIYAILSTLFRFRIGENIKLGNLNLSKLGLTFLIISVTFLLIGSLGILISKYVGALFGLGWLILTYLVVQGWSRHYLKLVIV